MKQSIRSVRQLINIALCGQAFAKQELARPMIARRITRDKLTTSITTTTTLRAYSTRTAEDPTSFKQCPFCGARAALAAYMCSTCASPSPIPDSVSHYSHFPSTSAPPAGPFTLDTRQLRREFLQIQQKIHPDRFSNDEKKRMVAEGTSSLLNKAYTTLQQPLSRAEYILSLNGQEMGEGESLTDSAVLMTVMEAQETIEEAASESDLVAVKAEAKELIQAELETLSNLFAESRWAEAKQSAVRLRYWLNIQKSANEWEAGQEVRLNH